MAAPLAIAYAVVMIIVALGVYQDAKRLGPGALRILSPEIWALFCGFGSVPAVALYWAAHHSTFGK